MNDEQYDYDTHQDNIETTASNVKELTNLILINIENLDLSKRTHHNDLRHEYLSRVKAALTEINSTMTEINTNTYNDSEGYYSSSMHC